MISLLFLPQVQLFLITNITTAIIAIGTELPKTGKMVLIAISFLTYLFMIINVFVDGGFINHIIFYLNCSITAMIILVLVEILLETNQKITPTLIFIGLGLYIVVYIVIFVLLNRVVSYILGVLDNLMEDNVNLDKFRFKSVRKFLRYTIIGFDKAHPVCINFSLFKKAIEKWPNDIRIWTCFAKFVAIYPEETQTLALICQRIMANHIKGSVSKNILEQGMNLMTPI